MASPTTDEKKAIASPPMVVQTTRIREKSSQDTLGGSPTLSPCLDMTTTRRSDVSTPTSATANNPFDTDVEANLVQMVPTETRDCTNTNSSSRECFGRKSTNGTRLAPNASHGDQDCQVWPGRGHWMRKAKAAKRKNRTCNCLSSLSPRTRLIVKILIGLFIVALAIGVGFGISKPLGASIWKPSS